MEKHIIYMRKAIKLAKQAKGSCSPNPAVGALIVKNNSIISYGMTMAAGSDHAEVVAIKKALLKEKSLKNATLYVTLEPCSFFGKTPPCTSLIIKEGISNIVIGATDKNPKVRGISILKKAKKKLIIGVEEEEIDRINEDFNKFITSNMPFCTAKYAMTLDGKIATDIGDSKWISNAKARNLVQEMRNTSDSIMIGANTLISDNPQLSVRIKNKHKDPLRIILLGKRNIPAYAKVLQDEYETLFVVKKQLAHYHKELCRLAEHKENKKIIYDHEKGSTINLTWLFKELAEKKQISSILLEGGSTLMSSALAHKLIDKIVCFIAPKIIAGSKYPPFKTGGVDFMKNAYSLQNISYKTLGDNIMCTAYLSY